VLELRVRPQRLTREIAGFVDACWDDAGVSLAVA
jgi:hypothetical protein